MEKFISLANPQTIYYLWKDEEKKIVVKKLINSIIVNDYEYSLNDFNHTNKANVRSYLFFESINDIIMIDFNFQNDYLKYNLDLDIIKYYESYINKRIYLIMFNFFKGKNSFRDNIYSIYQNSTNNNLIKFLFSKNVLEQKKYDEYNLVEYFNNLGQDFYHNYLIEKKSEENIYSIFNL